MKKIEFEYYDWAEFVDFLDRLPRKDAEKLTSLIVKIEQYELTVARRQEWVKKLDKNLFEIRSKCASNIQRALYFHLIDQRYVITNTFTKKTQKTPNKEIQIAKNRRTNYKEKNHE